MQRMPASIVQSSISRLSRLSASDSLEVGRVSSPLIALPIGVF
jgi:hypothetical protein